MLSISNAEPPEDGSHEVVMLSAPDWAGAGLTVVVSSPYRDANFESLQPAHLELVQADGKPFPSAGNVQSTREIFVSDSFLSSEHVVPAALLSTNGFYWPKLDSVNLYVSQVETQLLNFQSHLSKLYPYLQSSPVPDFFSGYWPDEFEDLYSQAYQLGVATSRLRRARRLAAWNAAQACRFLAREIRDAITEKVAHLRRRLRIAKALKSKLLRLFASVYQFRNPIVLQRRCYLAHGSHPIENFTFQSCRWSLGQRGCVPAFLQ